MRVLPSTIGSRGDAQPLVALEETLGPDVATRAGSIATAVRRDGAVAAAQRLTSADL